MSKQNAVTTQTRPELEDRANVFFVTSWGYAADHYFSWFCKSLNAHRDIFALLAHEGSRPKYLKERTRSERPPLKPFLEFLTDMGMTYEAIGDCYSYRVSHFTGLKNDPAFRDVPLLNLVRHPVIWLEFYIRWRATNMRMGSGANDPLLWEWLVAKHNIFAALSLKPYEKDEVHIWSAYEGMRSMNKIAGEVKNFRPHCAIERLAASPEAFQTVVTHLTKGRVHYDQADLDRAFGMRDTLFRGEEKIETDPQKIIDSWPGWKVDAFRKLVSEQALAAYRSIGYLLQELEKPLMSPPSAGGPTQDDPADTDHPHGAKPKQLARPIFITSLMKSGTWLIREVIHEMTGLTFYEPDVSVTGARYADPMVIEFPPGRFFSWHSVMNSSVAARIQSSNALPIFLVRNIYDLILAIYDHHAFDIDAELGRSTNGAAFFAEIPLDQRLAIIINGAKTENFTWHGIGPHLYQMESMLEYHKTFSGFLLNYDGLVKNKAGAVEALSSYLRLDLNEKDIARVVRRTDKKSMAERLVGGKAHVRSDDQKLARPKLKAWHVDMVSIHLARSAPGLLKSARDAGVEDLLYPPAHLKKDL